MLYNVYCDETCHLENDGINVISLFYFQNGFYRKSP